MTSQVTNTEGGTDGRRPVMRYNPDIAPDPAAWLETDEDERLIAIQSFHARAGDRSQARGQSPDC